MPQNYRYDEDYSGTRDIPQDFSETGLNRVSFSGCDLRGVKFTNTQFVKVIAIGAILPADTSLPQKSWRMGGMIATAKDLQETLSLPGFFNEKDKEWLTEILQSAQEKLSGLQSFVEVSGEASLPNYGPYLEEITKAQKILAEHKLGLPLETKTSKQMGL